MKNINKTELNQEALEEVTGGASPRPFSEVEDFIRTCKLSHMTIEQTLQALMKRFHMALAEAEKALEKYWGKI